MKNALKIIGVVVILGAISSFIYKKVKGIEERDDSIAEWLWKTEGRAYEIKILRYDNNSGGDQRYIKENAV